MTLAEYEAPVAYSMVRAAAPALLQPTDVMTQYLCYWAAFNNIYVTLAERAGQRAEIQENKDGTLKTHAVAHMRIPKVKSVSERDQISLAFGRFSLDLKRALVEHESARFFVERTPSWHGQPIAQDADGQQLNGVINVGHTTSFQHPVWAPIDTARFHAYRTGAGDPLALDALAEQILNVLYAVRNNLFHGGKRVDDANDNMVLEAALPLLAMVVRAFLRI